MIYQESNCCHASVSEVDQTGIGRCNDCKEMCSVETYEDEPTTQSLIEEKIKAEVNDDLIADEREVYGV